MDKVKIETKSSRTKREDGPERVKAAKRVNGEGDVAVAPGSKRLKGA